MWRNTSSKTRSSKEAPASKAEAAIERAHGMSIELQILSHALTLFQIFAEVGRGECDDAVAAAREQGAQRDRDQIAATVSAVLRRVMPALRIETKWLKSHLDYIHRGTERAANLDAGLASSLGSMSMDEAELERQRIRRSANEMVIDNVSSFWRSYADFINTIRFAFPYESLPNIPDGQLGAPSLCLEEDIDMRGFTPIKKGTISAPQTGMGEACVPGQGTGAHPNEEQLMRISDLLVDAKVIAESINSPIIYDDQQAAFLYPENPLISSGQHAVDGMSEGASESTDDILDLAMHAVDRNGRASPTPSSDDEDDQILIPSALRSAPPLAFGNGGGHQEAYSPATPTMPTAPAQSAQDLLLQVLNGPRPGSEPKAAASFADHPQGTGESGPHLLFGGMGAWPGPGMNSNANIWAADPSEGRRLTPRPGESAWGSSSNSVPLPPPGHPSALAFQQAFAGPNSHFPPRNG